MKAKSIGCVVFREEPKDAKRQSAGGERKYLLLEARRINDKLGLHTFWDFPKGAPDKGENELQTALRETSEESGISDLNFIDGFRKSIRYFFKMRGKLINKEVVYYLAKTETGKAKVSGEHVAAKWLTYEKTLKALTFKNSKSVLQAAEEFLNKNSNPAHTFNAGSISKRKIKAVIFDWNGVITDSLKLDHEIFIKECAAGGVKAPRSVSFYANMFNENVYESFDKIGFHITDKEENVYKKLYMQNLHRIKPFDGINGMLDGLSKNYTLAIITSNYRKHVRKFFRNHRIKGFSVIFGSETDKRKENKMKLLMERLSIRPDEIIFVGDTVSDIVACKAARVRIIAVTWGYQSRATLQKHNPDFIAKKPEDVVKILENIENGR